MWGWMCHWQGDMAQVYDEPASMEADFGGGDIVYDVVVILKSSSPIAGDGQRGHDQGSESNTDITRGCLHTHKVHLAHTLGPYMRQGKLG